MLSSRAESITGLNQYVATKTVTLSDLLPYGDGLSYRERKSSERSSSVATQSEFFDKIPLFLSYLNLVSLAIRMVFLRESADQLPYGDGLSYGERKSSERSKSVATQSKFFD